jgi:hypothetical protein
MSKQNIYIYIWGLIIREWHIIYYSCLFHFIFRFCNKIVHIYVSFSSSTFYEQKSYCFFPSKESNNNKSIKPLINLIEFLYKKHKHQRTYGWKFQRLHNHLQIISSPNENIQRQRKLSFIGSLLFKRPQSENSHF